VELISLLSQSSSAYWRLTTDNDFVRFGKYLETGNFQLLGSLQKGKKIEGGGEFSKKKGTAEVWFNYFIIKTKKEKKTIKKYNN